MSKNILEVKNLSISFNTSDGQVHAVDNLSFNIKAGEVLGIVGESGSGKSVTASAIMGLLTSGNVNLSGSIKLNDFEIVGAKDSEVRKLRGSDIAMVFQDPLSSLNPYYKIGVQIGEAYETHHPDASKVEVRNKVIEVMKKVGIPEAERRIDSYPHEFSGGMRQRVVIAIALINDPKILIADEPTTALDVTVQAQILDLMRDLQKTSNTSIILITHDLGVVAEMVDRVLVMYAGRAVEVSGLKDIFSAPIHPYTKGLLSAVRSLDTAVREKLATIPGTPPSLLNIPQGCAFNPRCFYKQWAGDKCSVQKPELHEIGNGLTACHLSKTDIERMNKDEMPVA
jgi:peptide/nickel transport system ATP-binding protein